jgi:DNA polymerase elongation subunit (family B)
MPSQKILYFDVETVPLLAHTWSKWVDGPVVAIERDWNLICIAWHWEGDETSSGNPRIHVQSLQGQADVHDDTPLLDTLWDLFNDADIVIGHNGNKFDIPKVQARFLLEGYGAPSPFDGVDTLSIVKRHFKLTSNRLGDVGEALDIGGKTPHTGWEMWDSCLKHPEGDHWKLMEKYNIQDIALLVKLYKKVRSWATSHPTVHVSGCPICGSSHIQSRGSRRRKSLTYPQFQCQAPDCGAWFLGTRAIKEADKPVFKSAVRR